MSASLPVTRAPPIPSPFNLPARRLATMNSCRSKRCRRNGQQRRPARALLSRRKECARATSSFRALSLPSLCVAYSRRQHRRQTSRLLRQEVDQLRNALADIQRQYEERLAALEARLGVQTAPPAPPAVPEAPGANRGGASRGRRGRRSDRSAANLRSGDGRVEDLTIPTSPSLVISWEPPATTK